ncbi:MAG: DNA-directed RNA polymerase subunit beta' [Oscillospiraceae bacterium]|nr:DNA-directed RNA polymerase subunit beta' [Oscillospiraceae bacterium]
MGYTDFEAVKIALASPELIRDWSRGEIRKPETINYRTLKPEREGLFCEKIFGPQKDWECYCGKYKKIRYKGRICDRCGVEVTRSKVRRDRMGHIQLAAPVSHIWYFKGIPSRMGLILNMSPRVLEKVLYFAAYIVIDPGDAPLDKNQILTEKEYSDFREKYEDDFEAGMGAEAIKKLLEKIDCEALSHELREELKEASSQKKMRLIKRLEAVDSFRVSGNRPEWMILDAIPVIPPDLRPMVQLDGGRFATSDLNDLYRRVINRNNRLLKLLQLGAPDIIVRNEKRMLQEAVDALIDNGRRGRPVTGPNNRALKSLSDLLKGKQGRFRQNLLGKRVDYSGRSVIVVGPELKIYQCGLPKEMALELFKPFVMKKLVEDGVANNIKSAKKMVERTRTEVWDALEVVISEHPVLLNRAPTLHRLGIQAFEPILVEGRALKLHPLVCTAYNADFDGDQMAVHVPLSAEAQAEARFLMLSANNLLHPKDGRPVTVPTQDMVLGSYYLTMERPNEKGAGKMFSNKQEALMAYNSGVVGIHAPIKVRFTGEYQGETVSRLVDCTVGRLIFNEPIPQDLGYVDRTDPARIFDLEISFLAGSKELSRIIDRCIKQHGFAKSAEVLDRVKAQGFSYSTQGAITISISDMVVPENKPELIMQSEKKVADIDREYRRGFITADERYRLVVREWVDTTDRVTKEMEKNLNKDNPIFMMAHSGARSSINQIRQLAGMRGLMANTAGKTIEIPIKSNFREGLSVLEYFISSRGARKGLADTALRTADSGYLTRRLVDVSQDVIIRELDCGTTGGIEVSDIGESGQIIEPLSERLVGRFALEDVKDDQGKTVIYSDTMLSEKDAGLVEEAGVKTVKIRSVLTCRSPHGVCAKCYGSNLATGEPVNVGESVGIIAAQSIGEPGTQLTMRTFHTGGIATSEDITQGLPRVEELFEARKPKRCATLSEIDGTISIEEARKGAICVITVTNNETAEVKTYQIPASGMLRAKAGDRVSKGDMLTEGSLNPHDILAIKGESAVHNYLISEVQHVYRQQGVDINDKHIEVIARQMMRKIRVESSGNTGLLIGSIVDIFEFEKANQDIQNRIDAGEADLEKADGMLLLLGITKASLATESFLSAASFQETTRVLTEAAIRGKVDRLLGLKENVIIGKLIPAGSGMEMYSDYELVKTPQIYSAQEENEYDDEPEIVSQDELPSIREVTGMMPGSAPMGAIAQALLAAEREAQEATEAEEPAEGELAVEAVEPQD